MYKQANEHKTYCVQNKQINANLFPLIWSCNSYKYAMFTSKIGITGNYHYNGKDIEKTVIITNIQSNFLIQAEI